MGRYARYAEENSRAVQHEPKSLTMREREEGGVTVEISVFQPGRSGFFQVQ